MRKRHIFTEPWLSIAVIATAGLCYCSASVTCPARVLVFGSEAALPSFMGFYSQRQGGQLAYTNAHEQVLTYCSSLRAWCLVMNGTTSTTVVARANLSNTTCPNDASQWEAWNAGTSTWMSSGTSVKAAKEGMAWQEMEIEVIGWSLSSRPMRMASLLPVDTSQESYHYSLGAQFLREAYRTYVEWVNSLGGLSIGGLEYHVELILADSDGESSRIAELMWQLWDAGITLFLGPLGFEQSTTSAAVLSAINFAETNAVLILPDETQSGAVEDSSAVFNTMPASPRKLSAPLQTLRQLGAKQVQLIRTSSETMHEVCDAVPSLAANLGMPVMQALSNGTLKDVVSAWGNSTSLDVVIGCMAPTDCDSLLNLLYTQDLAPPGLVLPGCVGTAGYFDGAGVLVDFAMGSATWVSSFGSSSVWADARLSDTDFAADLALRLLGRRSRSVEVPAVAASGFAAAEFMVSAVSGADSIAPAAVVTALQQLEINSVYGRNLYFDSNGRISLPWVPMQFLTRSFSVTSKEVAFGTLHVYPAPSFLLRRCFHRTVGNNFGIGPDGQCGECPSVVAQESHPHFRGDAWQHLPAWTCISLRCEPDVPALIIDALQRDCLRCPSGTLPLVNNRTVVTLGGDAIFVEWCGSCPSGTIIQESRGLQSCIQCPMGYEAPNIGSKECTACLNGTFAPSQGMQQCLPCPSGTIASGLGSTACQECPEGSIAEKVDGSAVVCTLCAEGRYQTEPGQTFCEACPRGTDCEARGTSALTNLPGWWLRAYPDTNCTYISNVNSTAPSGTCSNESTGSEWFPCTLNGDCLVGETCAKGSTGIACGVCLPRYTRIDGPCVRCPEWGANLAISFMIGFMLSAGMLFLTAISILGAGKAKSIISVLLKLALNYSTTMIIMTEIQDLVLLTHAKARQMRDPSLEEAQSAGLFRMTSNIMGASLHDLQGSLWSLSCLWHPTLGSADERIILEYAAARSTVKHLYQEGASKLLDFHELVELRSLIFYATIIPGMILGLLFIAALVLGIYLYIRRKFYEDVVNYFIRLGTKRIERAQKGMTAERIEKYHSMAEWRFLGIWKAVTIYRYRLSVSGVCSRFIYDSMPLLVVIAFVLYPFCLRSLLMPLRCEQPTDDVDGYRMTHSMDIECTWGKESSLMTVSIVCATGLGISLPFIGSMVIHYVQKHQFHSHHLQRTLNFLTGGYQLDRSWWECVVLVRKTLGMVLAAVQMSMHARLLGMVILAGFFLFLHVRYQPFDNRYNELLDTVETVHLVAWNVFSVALLAIYMLQDDQEAAISILLSGLLAVHFTFLVSLFGALAKHIMTSTALQIAARATTRLQGAGLLKRPPLGDLAQAELAAGRRADGLLLMRYAQIMNRTPYLSATISESGLLWFTVGGNLGGRCPLPRVHKRRLDEVMLPTGVQAPSRRSLQYALSIIFDAFEFILIEQRHLACSASLMEFVFRVAFTFGVDGTFRLSEADQLSAAAAEGYRVEPGRLGSALSRFSALFRDKGDSYSHMGSMLEAEDVAPGEVSRISSMEEGVGAVSTATPGAGTATGSTLGRSTSTPATLAESSRYMDRKTRSFRNVDSEAHKAQSIGRKWAGTRGSTKAIKQSQEKRDESYRKVVQKMYQTGCYEQGLTLEELQLNLTAKLGGTSFAELKDWLDFFEQEWLMRREEWTETNKSQEEAPPHGHLQSVSTLRNHGMQDFASQVHHESFLPELLLQPVDVPRQPDVEAQSSDSDACSDVLPGIAYAAHVWAPPPESDSPLLLPSLSSVWRTPTLMSWLRLYILLLGQAHRVGALDCTLKRVRREVDEHDFVKFTIHQHEESIAKVQDKLHQTEAEEAQHEFELGARIAELRTKLKDARTAHVQQKSRALRNSRGWDTYV